MLKQNAPQYVLTLNETTGVSGSTQFTLQNTDFNMLCAKLTTNYIGTSGFTACDIYIQTSDLVTSISGTNPTWYDLVHFATFNGSTLLTGSGVGSVAYWATFADMKGNAQYIGAAKSQSLSAGSVSKLPLLGRQLNVAYVYSGAVGSPNTTLQIAAVDADYR